MILAIGTTTPRASPGARAPRRSSAGTPATAAPSTNSEHSNLTGHSVPGHNGSVERPEPRPGPTSSVVQLRLALAEYPPALRPGDTTVPSPRRRSLGGFRLWPVGGVRGRP